MAEKIRFRKSKKELSNKIAEIIWLVLASLVFASGLVLGILGMIIDSMSGNLKRNPLYFLVEAQDNFFIWVKKWWSSYPSQLSQFTTTGLVLLFIGLVFLLIVLLVTSNHQEALNRKEKAKRLRENNVRRFEEQLDTNPEVR